MDAQKIIWSIKDVTGKYIVDTDKENEEENDIASRIFFSVVGGRRSYTNIGNENFQKDIVEGI